MRFVIPVLFLISCSSAQRASEKRVLTCAAADVAHVISVLGGSGTAEQKLLALAPDALYCAAKWKQQEKGIEVPMSDAGVAP